MLIKCNCNTCSTHLEFESQNAGRIIACPSCGMDTKLYIPPTAPGPNIPTQAQQPSSPVANPFSTPQTPINVLKEIRANTCYRTLRGLISGIQIAFFIVAGILVLGTIGPVLFSLYTDFKTSWDTKAGMAIYQIFGGLFAGALAVLLGVAWKQAALLLVDIADCQIQQIGQRG